MKLLAAPKMVQNGALVLRGPIFSDLVPTLADFTFLVKTRHEMRNKSFNWV
jgi:hypothetical protein